MMLEGGGAGAGEIRGVWMRGGGERVGHCMQSKKFFKLNINCLLCIQKHLSKAFLMPSSALLYSE